MAASRAKSVLLKCAIVALVSAAGVEIGARVLDRVRGKPWSAERSRAAVEEVCRMLARRSYGALDQAREPDPQGFEASILQPYTGWEHPSTQKNLIDDAAWYRRHRANGAYDVCILGGSVAQLFVEFGHPKFLELLERDPRFKGRGVRFHNYACAGYKQPQQSMVLAYLLELGHEPDVVIELDGFNEAALSWSNAKLGTHPMYPSVSHWTKATTGVGSDWAMIEHLHAVRSTQDRAREFGEWFLRSGLWRSCFLDHAVSLRLESLRRRYVSAYRSLMQHIQDQSQSSELRGPAFPGDDEALAKLIQTCWEQGSINLQAMCKARGITYLHVLQPTLHDEGSKPVTQNEIDSGDIDPFWLEGVKVVYPLLRESGVRMKERGVSFLDASGVFRDHPEDIYYDLCHFRERGNVILAEAIVGALLQIEKR